MLRAARSAGFTLTELLVGCTVGLLVAGGMTLAYAQIAAGAGRTLLDAQLRRSLSSAADVIAGDLRRAGYWSRARELSAGVANGYAPIHIVDDGTCVLFSYDEEADNPEARPRAADQHGLRLRGGVLQSRTSAEGCGDSTCTSCEGGVWWAITDPQAVTVTGFALALEEHTRAVGERVAVVRNVSFALTGALARHPAVRHTIEMQVNVRNDKLR